MAILLNTISAFSQGDYKPGYIIKNNSDTLNGLIDLRSNYLNSTSCYFKLTPDSKPEKFGPTQILAYHYEDGKYYVSRTITIDTLKRNVFLEFLVNGYVKLFFYKDFADMYYFIEKDSSKLYLIENKEIQFKDKYEALRVRYNKQYIGALKYLFRDDPGIYPQVEKSEFSYQSLINLSKRYHDDMCPGKECVVYVKKNTSSYWIAPIFGINHEYLKLMTSSDKAVQDRIFVGLQISRSLKIFSEHWNIAAGIIFSKVNTQGDFSNTIITDGYTRIHRITIKATSITIPIKFKYNIIQGRFRAGVFLGLHNVIYINPNYSVETISPNSRNDSPFRKYNLGLHAGFDFRYALNTKSDIFFQVGYEYRRPIRNNQYVLDYINYHSIPLQLGYEFKFK